MCTLEKSRLKHDFISLYNFLRREHGEGGTGVLLHICNIWEEGVGMQNLAIRLAFFIEFETDLLVK